MPALIADLIGGTLGIMLFATLTSWLLRKVVTIDPVIADAIAVVIWTISAPALYAYNSDGSANYWYHAFPYYVGGVLAFLIMWQLRRHKAKKPAT